MEMKINIKLAVRGGGASRHANALKCEIQFCRAETGEGQKRHAAKIRSVKNVCLPLVVEVAVEVRKCVGFGFISAGYALKCLILKAGIPLPAALASRQSKRNAKEVREREEKEKGASRDSPQCA